MSAAVLQAPVRSTAERYLELWGSYSLSDPWFLALVIAAPLFVLWGRGRRRHVPGRVPAIPTQLPRSLAQTLAWMPPVFECVALVLVVLALARPLEGNIEIESTSEGIDIVLLVDRSTSMTVRDLEPAPDGSNGRAVGVRPGRQNTSPTRLDVVKEVVGDFAVRRMNDRVGAADNVALVVFAKYPELRCPFTLDSNALIGKLQEVDFASRAEGGTGIGVAVAKAVAVLKESDAKSRVAILLTDGENNIELILPMTAARLAEAEGIKVYCVLAGAYTSNQFGLMVPAEELDSTALEAIAERTGGLFFRARDRAALEDVYASIEELERTEREDERFAEHFDIYRWFLLWSLAAYSLAWISNCTWARRLP